MNITRVIQILKQDGLAVEWQDIPIPATKEVWKTVKESCGAGVALRLIERQTSEAVVQRNTAAQKHAEHEEQIAVLDYSGDEE